MSGRRLFAIFRRVAQEIRRDHRSVALLFVVPIVMTGLITFIVREGESPTVVAVVVNAAGAPGIMATGALDGALAEDGGSATLVADEATARAAIEDGTASIAVSLPAGLGSGGPVTVTLLTDGLDPSGEAVQVAAVGGRCWRRPAASPARPSRPSSTPPCTGCRATTRWRRSAPRSSPSWPTSSSTS